MPDDPDARALMRQRHPAFEPTNPPPSEAEPAPSLMAKATKTPLLRVLALVAAASTGVAGAVTATGAAVVSVINAVAEAKRPANYAEIERRFAALEVRVNGDFGLPLETATRQKKEAELEASIEAVRVELGKLPRVQAKRSR